jgi:hypothetical protein
MSRGLSDLQKWMLVRALDNIESGLCGEQRAHLYLAEVKADYYKLPTDIPAWRTSERQRREHLREFAGGHFFVKSEIPNYGAIALAITRAARRLERRGLVEYRWRINLTEKGIEQARLLATPRIPRSLVQPLELLATPSVT